MPASRSRNRALQLVLPLVHAGTKCGEIVCAHVAEQFVIDAQRGYVDTVGLDLIARMHGSGWYARPRDLFQLVRPAPIE